MPQKRNNRSLFAFDEGDERFELLETERGAPEKQTGWNDSHKKSRKAGAIPRSVNAAEKLLRETFSPEINPDLIIRRFRTGGGTEALIAYMNGMADDAKINEFILKPLMLCNDKKPDAESLLMGVIEISETKRETSMEKAALDVMDGVTALFIEGEKECILLETRGFEKRSIGPAENETTVIGPKESFTESFRTNVTLIRRGVHTKDLIVEPRPSGGRNNTRLALVYRKGFTNPELLDEVKRRLDGIAVSDMPGSGVLEQLIEDCGWSPVPQILQTERPDRACSHLMQGRVCIVVEGSPFVLLMPVTLFSLMNSPEDVYLRKPLGTAIRLIRYAGALISVMLPGYFLALALYHQGVMSTEVLSTVIASRKMVFEPMGAEMIILLMIFQLIREAGLRVPGSIGQAIGIIGGLIMGQAAVAAHLASSVVLIVVAASGLGNFCIPDYSLQISAAYMRLAVVISAWMGGLLGMVAVTLTALCHLASLKSFGVPFLAPFAPKTYRKRTLVLRGNIGMHERADDYANTADDAEIWEEA
ncbi:MAG: spore germination protein [Clostridiales bacterium]|nr:spore germination protein [Clostridiales bacterium]